MIPLKRIPLLCAIIVTFSSAVFAQKFCTVAPPSPFHHSGLIVTSFDQPTGRMKTTLEHPRPMGDGVYLYASFFYQDRRLRTMPSVDIYFVSASKHPRYAESHEVSLYADGTAFPLGVRTNYFTERGDHGMTIEKTVVTLSYANLQSLLKARRVTARLGASVVEMTDNHLEALREIASLMGPPPANVARR